MAQMTLYRHFGGKDGVVAAAVEQWSAWRLGWLKDRLDGCGDDPEARFAVLWEALETAARPRGGWWLASGGRGRRAPPGPGDILPGRRSVSIGWPCASCSMTS